MADDYTPTTEEVREAYSWALPDHEYGKGLFDRFIAALYDEWEAELGETRWEYGTRRPVTDGWEPGDRYGEREYVDARSVSDRVGNDRSTVTGARDMTRAVRRRKAGPWEPVTNTESEGEA